MKNSVRFEVFKRDKFTCQYCGKKSPDAVLQVDHIMPVAKGGGDDIINLLTSCVECNSGKSDRLLSDAAMLDKSRRQLEELEERRQQLEMMVQWRESLAGVNDTLIASVERQITGVCGISLSATGRANLRKLIRDFGYDDVCDAVAVAMDRYIRWVDGQVTSPSFELAFNKIGGICRCKKRERENPLEAEFYFALNIWKKVAGNHSGFASKRAIEAIRAAHAGGLTVDEIKRICSVTPGITRLEDALIKPCPTDT